MKEPSDQFHRWLERLEEITYTIEVRKGANHGNADGLSRMRCKLNNCICEPVQQLELKDRGVDNHEVVYAEPRTGDEDSERYLELPAGAETELEERIKRKPKKKNRPKQVNFDKAVRGMTDSAAEAVPGVTDDHSLSGSSPNKTSKKVRRRKVWHSYDSRGESSDDDAMRPPPVMIQRVKTQVTSQGTQTGDETHQLHDSEERRLFARAVALGSLWSKQEMIDAQLEDVDIAPVVKALTESQTKPDKQKLQGITRAARFYFLFWKRLVLIDGVLYLRWESTDARRVRQRLILPFKYRDVVMVHLHDSNYAGHLLVSRLSVLRWTYAVRC